MATRLKKYLKPGFRGAIGKAIVIKQYAGKTVITAYPDMSSITPSCQQQTRRTVFAEAVAYARRINSDPLQRTAYATRIPKG